MNLTRTSAERTAFDRGDLANEVIAHKIIGLAKAGERDPKRLCDGVLQEFRKPPA
jgi:hypothetical protein